MSCSHPRTDHSVGQKTIKADVKEESQARRFCQHDQQGIPAACRAIAAVAAVAAIAAIADTSDSSTTTPSSR